MKNNSDSSGKPEKKISEALINQIESIGSSRSADDVLLKYFTEDKLDKILFSISMWALFTIQDYILFKLDYDEDNASDEENSLVWDNIVEYIESKGDVLNKIATHIFNSFINDLSIMQIEILTVIPEEEMEDFVYFKLENIDSLSNTVSLVSDIAFGDYELP